MDTAAVPTESLSKSISETDEKPASLKNVNEKSLSVKIEEMAPPDVPQVAASSNPPNIKDGLQTTNGFNHNAAYTSNIYAPQAHPVYYTGYGEWDEYQQHLNPEVMDLRSPGIYSDNMPFIFPTSFGYSPHAPYGPYSPVTTPLPSPGGDPQLYATQQYPFSGPYYQHPLPPNMVYPGSPSPQLQSDPAIPTAKHHGRNSFSGNSGNPGFYDSRHGFDGFGSGNLWSDWSKSPDAHISFSPAASPQPINAQGAFGHGSTPFASGLASPQQRNVHGFGSSVSSQDRGYFHAGVHRQSPNFGVNIGTTFNGWVPLEKGRRRGKDDMSLCTCADTNDFLSEQTRGPRATRTKNSTEEPNSSDGKNSCSTVAEGQLYNKHNFVTEYDHAKFFIIKSYTEDNVHKSIKYGVWASTPNGNRKLDSAYREAKENGDGYPIFLFFSVNSSAQFCGVAEMTGPVDFDKSVDYWQQDKWSGQFPVKWHIIKDVPNSVFRHIILENNDNKPVTNSRDTQEVKLEHGLEMLRLFKKHESALSILDDFDFYEERQKAMQERKKTFQKQQQSGTTATAFPMIGGIEHPHPPSISGNQMNQLSKSFAEIIIENKPTEKGSPPAANIGDASKLAATQSS